MATTSLLFYYESDLPTGISSSIKNCSPVSGFQGKALAILGLNCLLSKSLGVFLHFILQKDLDRLQLKIYEENTQSCINLKFI